MSETTSRLRTLAPILLLLILLPVLSSSIDLRDARVFFNTIQELRQGARLYSNPYFFYMPWSLAVIAPLTMLGIQGFSVSFVSICILAQGVSARLVAGEHVLASALGLTAPSTLLVLYMTQWDPLSLVSLLGVWLAARRRWSLLCGVGIAVCLAKPTHMILPLALICASHLPAWSWRDRLKSAIPTALALLGASLVFGWDWPLRFLELLQRDTIGSINLSWAKQSLGPISLAWPTLLAILACFAYLLRRAWRARERPQPVSGELLHLWIVLAILLTPYVTLYHYSLLQGALILIAIRRPGWAIATWLFHWGLVLYVWFFGGHMQLSLYPVVLGLQLAWLLYDANRTDAASTDEAGQEEGTQTPTDSSR